MRRARREEGRTRGTLETLAAAAGHLLTALSSSPPAPPPTKPHPPTHTAFPRAPSPLLAALFAPFAWAYGRPDLFDSYSAGVLLMQMAVP